MESGPARTGGQWRLRALVLVAALVAAACSPAAPATTPPTGSPPASPRPVATFQGPNLGATAQARPRRDCGRLPGPFVQLLEVPDQATFAVQIGSAYQDGSVEVEIGFYSDPDGLIRQYGLREIGRGIDLMDVWAPISNLCDLGKDPRVGDLGRVLRTVPAARP